MSNDSRTDHIITLALAAGKLAPGMVPWATKYAEQDPKGLLHFLRCTEVDGAVGRSFEHKSAQAGAISRYARQNSLRFGEARLEAIRELRELEG